MALHTAASAAEARARLASGADPNAFNGQGRVPLGFNQDVAVARVLLEYGADPQRVDVQGNTPIHYAKTPEMVRLLVAHGADVDARGGLGETALYRRNGGDVMRALLAAGADPNARNTRGETSLHDAAYDRSAKGTEDMRLLLDSGADMNARDVRGIAALHIVARYNYLHRAELLLAHGADPEVATNRGTRPLHCVKTAEAVHLLLEHGANIHAVDRAGRSTLQTAAMRDAPEAMRALLALGMDPTRWRGKRNYSESVDALLRAGGYSPRGAPASLQRQCALVARREHLDLEGVPRGLAEGITRFAL